MTLTQYLLQNAIFGFLQKSTPVRIWLYQQTGQRIEGTIRGFDEFMNVVLDDAVSVSQKAGVPENERQRRKLGRIMLKGDNISLIQALT